MYILKRHRLTIFYVSKAKWSNQFQYIQSKKNILKSNDFGVMQTVFFAFTCKFGLCLHVEKVVICINKTNWHHPTHSNLYTYGFNFYFDFLSQSLLFIH